MSHKLGVCVPYRNRKEHMDEFVPSISKFLTNKGIDHTVYIAHQVDDKLFNRGAMKNIAYDIAKDDGCDYFVFHDIDMVPEDDSCDYSYPTDHPVHIAVRISQSDYQLKYQEYFGGAVIFTREQYERVNGYSNDYWDWGMEDDDLYWRCYLNGYCDVRDIGNPDYTHSIRFNGIDSVVQIPANRSIKNLTSRSHTVSMLVKAEQIEEKVPTYLIGDIENRQFVEFPLLRRPGYDWGLSYNNSRAYTAMVWNDKNELYYQWMKRREQKWTWVTMRVDSVENKIHFYLNGNESDARFGTGTTSPQSYDGKLRRYGQMPYYIGHCTTTSDDKRRWFRGNVASLLMWNRALSEQEIIDHVEGRSIPSDNLKLHYRLPLCQNGEIIDLSGNENHGKIRRAEIQEIKDMKIESSILPHRRDGKFKCLPHPTEGLVDGRWIKGETTARNEYRYVREVQQGEWDIKNDGLTTLEYTVDSIETIYGNHKMINVRL